MTTHTRTQFYKFGHWKWIRGSYAIFTCAWQNFKHLCPLLYFEIKKTIFSRRKNNNKMFMYDLFKSDDLSKNVYLFNSFNFISGLLYKSLII